jgi:pimeloyl-ACP methyl ester carboxylesterase
MKHHLRLSDCTLFYETAGSGTPVVYVHGGFASLDTVINSPETNQWTWEHDFANHFFAIFYDLDLSGVLR